MRCRCNNPNYEKSHRYLGRGITIDPAWDCFDTFVDDMGARPAGTTIERIDNDKGYSKDNCKWATPKEQGNNRSSNRWIEYGEERLTLSQWSARTGLPKNTLLNRLDKLGWSIARAITTPRQTAYVR